MRIYIKTETAWSDNQIIDNKEKTGRVQTLCTNPVFLRDACHSIVPRTAAHHNYSLFILHYSFFIA